MIKADFKNYISTIARPDLATTPNQTQSQTYSAENVDKVDEIWKIVRENIKLNSSERTFNLWYAGVYLEKIENGVAQLSCDTHMKREWIENNHRALIRNKIQDVIGYKPDLVISIRSSIEQENAKKESYEYYDPTQSQNYAQGLFSTNPPHQQPASSAISQPAQSAGQQTNTYLNPKYRMDNFIVGSANQLAFAVSESVVDNPGTAYNPVFFYGPSGVGKTHLMQAIGNAIITRDPSKKVIYVPIETFMNEMIEAIRLRKNEEYRQKYRAIDLLIIDDIQFVSTYKKTKEELFNTFNALYQSNKQIVIASDRPPKEIENLPDRLRTRFEGGMVIDIQAPDLETRMAILQQHAKESKISVPSEIIMFIAQNIERSVRELEGAMNKVITQIKFTRLTPTIEDVAKMLQLDIDSKRKRIRPEKILEVVAQVFDLSVRDIKGQRRTAYVALARQCVMYLLREELQLPLEKIAHFLNRKDHTTVLHACNKLEELQREDEQVRTKLDKCLNLLRS